MLEECLLPLTGHRVVERIILTADMSVFDVDKVGGTGMTLVEIAPPGMTVQQVQDATRAEFKTVTEPITHNANHDSPYYTLHKSTEICSLFVGGAALKVILLSNQTLMFYPHFAISMFVLKLHHTLVLDGRKAGPIST